MALEGIEAEVIDLRTLRPLDEATILASVARTHRAVIVDEGWRSGSLPAKSPRASWSMPSSRSTRRWSACAAPKCRIPYPRHLELAATPQAETIVAACRQVLRR